MIPLRAGRPSAVCRVQSASGETAMCLQPQKREKDKGGRSKPTFTPPPLSVTAPPLKASPHTDADYFKAYYLQKANTVNYPTQQHWANSLHRRYYPCTYKVHARALPCILLVVEMQGCYRICHNRSACLVMHPAGTTH